MRGPLRVDPVSLASGTAVAALGALLLLDAVDALDLTLGWLAVALTGAVGAILLVGGLVGGGPPRDD